MAPERGATRPSAAEILTYRVEIDDTRDRQRDVNTWVRHKIFDPSRAVDITRVSWFWRGPANRNYGIKARLTLPDGTSRVFGELDLRTRKVAEENRANGLLGVLGTRPERSIDEKFLAVTGVVKGAVLDVWEQEPDLAKTDWLMVSVQRPDAPIRQFEYMSRYKPEFEVQHRGYVLNPNGGKMTEDEKAGTTRFVAQNLPSVRSEPLAAPETYFSLTIIETYESLYRNLHPRTLTVPRPDSVPLSLGPWAFYSTAQDFQDADKGYASKRVKEKAGELVAGATDPTEKARRIYSYVQGLYQRFRKRADLENWYTRYIESVDELIDLDQIDSTVIRQEDFRYLFVSLARSAGLECHSVFHPQRTSFPFRIDMVSEVFLSRESVAVNTGQGWVLCDPCAEVPLAFGQLEWEMEGQPALMALPRKQSFLNVPSLAAGSSRTDTSIELTLDPEGGLAGECVRSFTGHAAHVVRERLNETGQEDWWRLAKRLLDLEDSSSEVRLLKVEGLASPEEPLRVTAAVRWPSYAPVLSDRMTFALAVWREGRPPLLNESIRTTPVFFRFPSVERETMVVHLPAGFAPGTLPKPIEASSGDFSYALAATYDPSQGVLQVERTSVNGATEVPLAGYAKARDWFRRVSVADQIGIVLARAPAAMKGPKPQGTPP